MTAGKAAGIDPRPLWECHAWDTDGRCGEPATTLVEGVCRHEHHIIAPFCAWHASAAGGHCGLCMVTGKHKHMCPVTVRVVPGELGAQSS